MELGTAVAVAFARSPMQLAYTAHDLQAYSGGRFILGLGSQIKPHIERRFSMPWSHPAPRMREFVLAMRAIWSAWNDGTKLSFRGEFYQHTLMTPFFSPPPAPGGAPRVFLAAVGEAMTTVAGEVADGLLVHAFSTERYLREVTLPALSRGLDRLRGRGRAGRRGGADPAQVRRPDRPGLVLLPPMRPARRPGTSSCGASSRRQVRDRESTWASHARMRFERKG